MRNQRRADLLAIESQIDKAPICKRRNGEPRYVDQGPLVIQGCRQHRAGFGQECRAPLRRFSFSTCGFGANKLLALLFGALAFRDVIAGEDHVIGTESGFGPGNETGRSVFRFPVVFGFRHVVPGSSRNEEGCEFASLHFILRVTKNAFKGPAGTDNVLLGIQHDDDAVGGV